jgi:Trk K+ transport system NAD-binding subunit
MKGWKRRAVGYAGFLLLALILTALGYQWGMRVYEDRPRTFLDSFQFAVEMFTTTGFGGDAPWESPQMHLFITVTDILGMALLVGALPVFVAPVVENALSTTPPEKLESSLEDHVVICSDTTRAEDLIKELDANDIPYVIVEPDAERAVELYDDYTVINADPESATGLEAAGLLSARALFVDISDQVDASIVLTARELAQDVPIVSVVENPDAEAYHRLAGADHVLSPRSLLGESLAAKVTTAARTEISEAVPIDGELQLAEVSVRHGNSLVGSTLADSGIRERTGVNVIGAWADGDFNPASPDMELTEGSVLLVSGQTNQLERLVDITQSNIREFQTGKTIIIGYGQVGEAIATALEEADVPYTVVDLTDKTGVDVVGDGTEPDTLEAAGIADAEAVVLAMPDDTTTEFATLVVRDLAPDTQILARVEGKENMKKTYRAGADYVLSLAMVTARMSASRLLEDRDMVSLNQQVGVVRKQMPALAGETVGGANIHNKTGCTVVAIERGDETITDIGPETTIQSGDDLVLVGSDDAIRSLERVFTGRSAVGSA